MRAVVLMILVSLATVPPGAGTQPAPKPLRVLCWNIHHAEGTDGKLDLSRVARVIKAAQPDLVFLQEVDRNTTRTGKVDPLIGRGPEVDRTVQILCRRSKNNPNSCSDPPERGATARIHHVKNSNCANFCCDTRN